MDAIAQEKDASGRRMIKNGHWEENKKNLVGRGGSNSIPGGRGKWGKDDGI